MHEGSASMLRLFDGTGRDIFMIIHIKMEDRNVMQEGSASMLELFDGTGRVKANAKQKKARDSILRCVSGLQASARLRLLAADSRFSAVCRRHAVISLHCSPSRALRHPTLRDRGALP